MVEGRIVEMRQRGAASRGRWLWRHAAVAAMALLGAPAVLGEPGADPRLKPGARFSIEFPNLPRTRTDDMSKMQVVLPSSYDPNKQYPLIVWMGGGDGGPGAGGTAVVGKDSFVCAGLPFLKGANNAHQSNMVGNFPVKWAYHRHMLDELQRVVPNISPQLRVIGGFSNGGHTTAGYMGIREQDFPTYFNVYMPVEAVFQGGTYTHLAGRRIFISWGEGKGSNKGGAQTLVAEAARAGMLVQTWGQPNTGHGFDAEAQGKAADWLKKTVIADLLAQATAGMEKSGSGTGMPKAFALAKGVEVLAPGTPSEAKFAVAFEKLETNIRAEFAALRKRVAAAKSPGEKKGVADTLKTFLRNYRLSSSAAECRQILSELAQPEFDKLAAALPKQPNARECLAAAQQLRQFVKDWEFTTSADSAQTLLETYAQQALVEVKGEVPAKATAVQREAAIRKVRKFLTDWADTRAADEGMAVLADLGRQVLSDLKAGWPENMPAAERDAAAQKLAKFRDAWKGTPVAGDAGALLGKFGEQEIEAFRATWPSPLTALQKRQIAAQLAVLQKKWEGTIAADTCARLIRENTR